jgi:hypothetical protein
MIVHSLSDEYQSTHQANLIATGFKNISVLMENKRNTLFYKYKIDDI